MLNLPSESVVEERILRQNILLEGINQILHENPDLKTREELGRACLAIAEEITQSKLRLHWRGWR